MSLRERPDDFETRRAHLCAVVIQPEELTATVASRTSAYAVTHLPG